MAIVAAADYLVSVRKGTMPDQWKEQFTEFLSQKEIRIVKQTKRICLPKISLLFSVQIRFVWFSFIKIPFVLISVCFLCLYQ